jgi:DNA polymerase-3 subunit alpha
MFRISLKLEGLKKNTSVHASGVVISSVELDKIIPVLKDGDNLITGITVDEHLESMGLLKMDFLALKNLTTISNIINNIGKNVLKDIKFNESSVYKLFSDGDTDGIFQFETSLMRNLVSKIKPTCFNDLVASVALGRPGPINEANSYVLRKNGKEKVTYIDNRLKGILEDTYGILIYQEQIIEILGLVGGFKYSEADIIRRAISKKKISIMNEYFEKFINGAISNGYSKEDATKIYELIVRFASYGFNKSHSVAYAMVAYKMAYLKVFYPEYFLIEMLNNNTDKQSSYFAFLKSRGMILIKPDINISKIEFYVKGKNVIMPMWQIKGINREITRKIIDARGNGFIDYFDFVSKTHEFLDSSLIEALIKANALRSLKLNQNTLLNNLESATNYGALNDESGLIKKPVIIEYPEFSDSILRSNELDAYGYYLSNHPSSNFKCFKISDINKYLFKNVKCVVLVERINKIKTKKGDDMAFIRASDESGACDFTVFPEKFGLLDSLKERDLIEISGSVSKRFDKVSIIVNNIMKEGTHE